MSLNSSRTLASETGIEVQSADLLRFRDKLERSIFAVRGWVENNGYRGYDPADGNSSFLHFFTFGHVFLQRVLQQVVLRSPWNIRPILGIRPLASPHARGYMVMGYAKLFRETSEIDYQNRAAVCLDWLIENRSPGYRQYCWGNQFNYATRGGKRSRYEPIIVWSAIIGQAFVEAYETFGDRRYLNVAESVCDWILELPREKTTTGSCISYVAFKQSSIHNSNMLGAALLARLAGITGNSTGLEVSREAMLYSCSRLRPDGSWLYGEAPMHHWIDNFHTGYNLECLKLYMDWTGDRQFEEHQWRGLEFFKKNFFDADGAPKYYHDRKYPVDIQSASQAIDTLALFSDVDPDCFVLALKVAEWTIDNMQAKDGHFHYRDIGWKKVKTPMIHWGQATMFKAMVSLLGKIRSKEMKIQTSDMSARSGRR